MNIGTATGTITIEADQAISSLQNFGSALQAANGAGMQSAQEQGRQIQQVGLAYQQAGRVAIGAGALMAAPFVGAAKAAIDFESQMAGVNAVMDLQGDEFKQLSDLAQQLGADTIFSGTEAAAGIETLGKAGIEATDILEGAGQATTDLAAAAETSTEQAADTIAAGIQAFGLAGDEAQQVADVVAGAANASLASAADLAMGLGNVGSTAAAANMDLYETGAMLAVLTDRGQSGTDAATTLRTAISHLIAPIGQTAKEMGNLGISFTDAEGQFIGMENVGRLLVKTFDELGMSEADQLESVKKLAGQDGMRALLGVMDAIRKEGDESAKGWDDYTDAVSEAGAAHRIAEERMDSTAGAIERLQGSLATLGERVGAPLLAAIRPVVEFLDMIVDGIASLPGPVLAAVAAIGSLTAAFTLLGGGALFAAGHIMEAIGRLVSVGIISQGMVAGLLPVLGIIAAIIAALVALGIAYNANLFGVKDLVEGTKEEFDSLADSKIMKGGRELNENMKGIWATGELIEDMTPFDGLGQSIKDAAFFLSDFGDEWEEQSKKKVFLGGKEMEGFNKTLRTLGETLKEMGFDQAGEAIKRYAAAAHTADDAGFSPLHSTLVALSAAARAMGWEGLALGIDQAIASGLTFTSTAQELMDNGINPLSAAIAAAGVTIQELTGLPVAETMVGWADAIQSGVDAFDALTAEGVNPASAALTGLAVTLSELGFEGVAEQMFQIAGAAERFGDEFQAATNAGLNPFHAAVQAAAISIGELIGLDMTGLTERLNSIGDAFSSVATAIQTGDWGSIASLIGDALGQIAAGAIELAGWTLTVGIPAFISFLGDVAGHVGNWISTNVNNITGVMGEFKNWVLNVALPTTLNWLSSLAGWVQIEISKAVAAITVTAQTVKDWVLNIAVPTALTWLGSLAGAVQIEISKAVAAISIAAQTVKDWVLNVAVPETISFLGSVAGAVQIKISEAVANISIAAQEFKNWVLNVAVPETIETIGDLSSDVGAKVQEMVSGIKVAAQEFRDWILNVVGPSIVDKAGDVSSRVGGIVSKVVGSIKVAAQEFSDWIVNVLGPSVVDKAGDIASRIGSITSKAVSSVKTITETFTNWVIEVGIPETEAGIKVTADFAGALLSEVGTAISDALSNINVGDALSGSFEAGSGAGAMTRKIIEGIVGVINDALYMLGDPGMWKNLAIGTAGIAAGFTAFLGGFLGGLMTGEQLDAGEVFAPITNFFQSGLVEAFKTAIGGGIEEGALQPGMIDPGGIADSVIKPLSVQLADNITSALSGMEIDFGSIPNPLAGFAEMFAGWVEEAASEITGLASVIQDAVRGFFRDAIGAINEFTEPLGVPDIELPALELTAREVNAHFDEAHANLDSQAKQYFSGADMEVTPGAVDADIGGAPVNVDGDVQPSTMERLRIEATAVQADLTGATVEPLAGVVLEPVDYTGPLRMTAEGGVYLTDAGDRVVLTPQMEQQLVQDGIKTGDVQLRPGGFLVGFDEAGGEGAITFTPGDFMGKIVDPAVANAVESAPPGTKTIEATQRAVRNNVVKGIETLPSTGTGAVQTTGLVSMIDNFLGTSMQDAQLPVFVQQAAATIQEGLGKIGQFLTGGGADTGEATQGAQGMGDTLLRGIAAEIAAADPAPFTMAIKNKITEAISTGLSEAGGGAAPEAGGAAGGIGTSIVTSLVSAIQGADFLSLGSTLSTKIGEALQQGMTQAGGQAGGAGAAGGAGGSIGTGILQSITSAIEGADFATLGTTISTKISESLTAATGEGGEVDLSPMIDAAIQSGVSAASSATQIGEAIATHAGSGAASGQALNGAVTTLVTAGIQTGVGAASGAVEIGTMVDQHAGSGAAAGAGFSGGVTTMVTAGIAAGVGASAGATEIGTMTATHAGAGAASAGEFNGAVVTMVTAGIAAGVGAAGGATAIGAAVSAGAAAGIDVNALVGPAVQMVNNAIAAANAAAGTASPSKVFMEIGGWLSEGAAIGVAKKAPMVEDSVRDMVEAAIAETEGLQEIGSKMGANTSEVNKDLQSITKIAGILERAPGWNEYGSVLRSSAEGIKDSVGAIREDVRDLAQSVKEQLRDMIDEFKRAGEDAGEAIGEGVSSGSAGSGGGIGEGIEDTINEELKNINIDDFVIDREIFDTAREGRTELNGVGKELRTIEEIAGILERAPGWNNFGQALREAAGNIEGDVGGARDKFTEIMASMNEITRNQTKAITEALKRMASEIATAIGDVTTGGVEEMKKGTQGGTQEVAESANGLVDKWSNVLNTGIDQAGTEAGNASEQVTGTDIPGGLNSGLPSTTEAAKNVGTQMGDSVTTGMETGTAGATPAATEAGNTVGGAFNTGVGSNIPEARALGAQISNAVLEALRASAIGDTEAVRLIGENFGKAFGQGLSSAAPEAQAAGQALTDATETGMVAGQPSAVNTSTNVGEAIGTGMENGLQSTGKEVQMAGRDLSAESAVTGVQSGERTGTNQAENAGEAIGEALSSGISMAANEVEKAGRALGLDSVVSIAESIQANQAQMKTEITEMVNNSSVDPTATAKPVGTDFIGGMISGLEAEEGSLYAAVTRIVKAAIAAADAEADNASPSKKMMLWGNNMGDGMVVGLEQKREPVVDTMRSITEAAIDAAHVGEIQAGSIAFGGLDQNMRWTANQLESLLEKSTSARLKDIEMHSRNQSGLAVSKAASRVAAKPMVQIGDIVIGEGDPGYNEARGFIDAIAANHPAYYGSKRK